MTAALHPPRRGPYSRGEGAPRPRQAPQVNRPHAPALPAADRRRTGGTQDGANGAAPSEAGLGKAGARTRAGWFPPPPLPPRRTDPLVADRAAPDARGRPATPTARVYPGGARRRQRMAGRRLTGRGGRGGGGAAPPPPPPAPPPQLEGHRGDPPPPRSRGDAPPPREGTATPGGGDAAGPAHRAPQRPQPPAPDPHQRAGAARGPSLGAAHGSAPEQYGGRAPHDPPQ